MSGPTGGTTNDLVQEENTILQTEGTDGHARREQTNGAEAKKLAEEQVRRHNKGDSVELEENDTPAEWSGGDKS
ncbi:MAG: hypothetical protein JWN41_518 [Thermoleophilia bacterium]|nr:hypothetical protein [Thermoleophilia bacterium]